MFARERAIPQSAFLVFFGFQTGEGEAKKREVILLTLLHLLMDQLEHLP